MKLKKVKNYRLSCHTNISYGCQACLELIVTFIDGTVQEHDRADVEELREGAQTEHDEETSDSDEEHESGIDDEPTVEASVDRRYIYTACSCQFLFF